MEDGVLFRYDRVLFVGISVEPLGRGSNKRMNKVCYSLLVLLTEFFQGSDGKIYFFIGVKMGKTETDKTLIFGT